MPPALLVSVRFHDGRYHGAEEWPPSPARLFQALVAAAATGESIAEPQRRALLWLETLDAPLLATPRARRGRLLRNYVPNNDLDAKGGDPALVSSIRVAKSIRPVLFDADIPLIYLWQADAMPADNELEILFEIVHRLYQLGRGVDMASAEAEVVDHEDALERVRSPEWVIHRPSGGRQGVELACPAPGSLSSLERRFAAFRRRLEQPERRKGTTVFAQPPKASFRRVTYNSPPARLLYELRDPASTSSTPAFVAYPHENVTKLVESVRDRSAAVLRGALPDRTDEIERCLIGRGARDADKATRIRIVPLPSIGHVHAERSIRRVLVEVPPECSLTAADVDWALTTAESDPESQPTGLLVRARDDRMLRHYGVDAGTHRRWRTITPAALPESASRRRIDSMHRSAEAKAATERLQEEAAAILAVHAALRHSGVTVPVRQMRVQREAYAARGLRAEAFATAPRFSKHRLWHVEVVFAEGVSGPLVIGDGRYLGLGLMAPERELPPAVLAYDFEAGSEPPATSRREVLEALRRALMALDRDVSGDVGKLFSGHEADGTPAADGTHRHVFLAAGMSDDQRRLTKLFVVRPDLVDRSCTLSREEKERFATVAGALRTLRTGKQGVFRLEAPCEPDAEDPLFSSSMTWRTLTPYEPTRHPKRGDDRREFLREDVLAECRRRGLPNPRAVEIEEASEGAIGAVHVRIDFAVAVSGPILLGRGCHRGEGLFTSQ